MRTNTRRQGVAATALIAIGSALSSTGCETDRFVQPRIETTALAQVVRSGGVPINVKTGYMTDTGFVEGAVPSGGVAMIEVTGDKVFLAGQQLQIWMQDASGRFVSARRDHTVPTTDRVVRFRLGRAQLFEGMPGQMTSVPVLVVTEVEGELRGSAGVFTLSPAEPVAP